MLKDCVCVCVYEHVNAVFLCIERNLAYSW